jgi:hypothetical protein
VYSGCGCDVRQSIVREIYCARYCSGYNRDMEAEKSRDGAWTLLTGHGHVLVEIARSPDARLKDIADVAGITERAVQAIVSDLEAAGYLTRQREGRRNRYIVNPDCLFRHSAQDGHRVGPFLALLAAEGDAILRSQADDVKNAGGR